MSVSACVVGFVSVWVAVALVSFFNPSVFHAKKGFTDVSCPLFSIIFLRNYLRTSYPSGRVSGENFVI